MFERDDAQLCRLGVLHLLASSSPHFHTPPFRKLCCIQAHSLDTLFQPRVDIRTATKERSATNQPQPNNHKHSTRETRQKNRTHQHQNRSKYQDIDTQYQDTFGKKTYIYQNTPPSYSHAHFYPQATDRPNTEQPTRRRTQVQPRTPRDDEPINSTKNPNEFIRQKPLM